MTNVKPFQGDTLHTVMYKVLSETPPPLDKVLPGLPAALNGVVMRALQKDPAERFASSLEMANDLTTIRASLGDSPNGTRTLSLRRSIETALAVEREARRRVERSTKYALAGAGALVVVAVVGALIAIKSQGARPSTPTSSSASQVPAPTVSSAPPAAAAASQGSPAAPQGRAQDSVAATSPPVVREQGRPTRDTAARTAARATAPREVATRPEQRTTPTSPRNTTTTGATASASNAAATSRVPVTPAQDSQRPPIAPPSAPSLTNSPAVHTPITSPAPKPAVVSQPVDPAVEINALVAAYGRAIEARDLPALRRLYPEMSSAQQQGFRDFFSFTRTLKASLTVSGLQVDGSSAEAQLSGLYEYVTNAGRDQRQPVSFQATLRQGSDGWKFVSIR